MSPANLLRFTARLMLAACLLIPLSVPARSSARSKAPRISTRKTVVIDPGHGGYDKGTRWGGVSEKTLTLSISRRVAAILRSRGISTTLTRDRDRYVSLEQRAVVANSFRNAVFVSIHCNADPAREARGIETFYYGSAGARLARNVHVRLDSRTSTPNRGVKFAGYSVLKKTRCPAALVECGFLTSPSERRLLGQAAYQERLARAIADGIAASLR